MRTPSEGTWVFWHEIASYWDLDHPRKGWAIWHDDDHYGIISILGPPAAWRSESQQGAWSMTENVTIVYRAKMKNYNVYIGVGGNFVFTKEALHED